MPFVALTPFLIDQIAAGEVIERPAAAVKGTCRERHRCRCAPHRLVVEKGGRRLIRVTDDGSGMGPDDLALAIERHATLEAARGAARSHSHAWLFAVRHCLPSSSGAPHDFLAPPPCRRNT